MNSMPIVAIGASAGGLEAYKAFLDNTPHSTGAAYVLVPHLDPAHKSMMVEILSRHTAMPVVQIKDRTEILADHVYIVPPNRNLFIERGMLIAGPIEKASSINMPIDIFFRSLAMDRQERAIGIVLSGTMSDGTMGLRAIKDQGGMVIAQLPETAQHSGMPQSAINTGLVDLVLPIEEMPDAIVKYITHSSIKGATGPRNKDQETSPGIKAEGIVIHGADMTELENALTRLEEREAMLHEANSVLQAMNENTHMLTAYLDTEFNFISVNNAYAESGGHEKGWFAGKNHFDLYPHEENERIFRNVLRSGKPHTVEAKLFAHPQLGDTYWNWGIYPVKDSNKGTKGLVLTLIDVTGMIQAEQAYNRELETRNRILESISDGFFSLDRELRVIFFNAAAERILNRKAKDIIGQNLFDAFPEARGSIFEKEYKRAIEENRPTSFETFFEDHKQWYDVHAYPHKGGLSVYFRITTEEKKAHMRIEKALSEKDVLMQELSHRTKNNMNVISSIVGLYADRAKDMDFKTACSEIQSKISVMSLVHKHLYDSPDLSSVSLRAFIQDTCNLIIASFGQGKGLTPDFSFAIEDIKMPLQIAVPVGLVFNELLTNSLKYAFADDRKGRIRVEISMGDDGRLAMYYSDNGIGVSDELLALNANTLGWRLLHSIVTHQLLGDISWKSEGGFHVYIKIPLLSNENTGEVSRHG